MKGQIEFKTLRNNQHFWLLAIYLSNSFLSDILENLFVKKVQLVKLLAS